MSQQYQFRQCISNLCRFRYPVATDDPRGEGCPLCGAETKHVSTVELDNEQSSVADTTNQPTRHVDVLLDNIRSLYNVGSIFRTADGAGIRHLYLCGITPTPDNPKLAKTALGAEQAVAWSYHANAVDQIEQEKSHYLVWALEETSEAQSLFEPPPTDETDILLIVGNERTGIDPGIIDLCDAILYIPMRGAKRSLNVATAFGIAAYALVGES